MLTEARIVKAVSIYGYLDESLAYAVLPIAQVGQLQRLHLDHFHIYPYDKRTTETTDTFLAGLIGACTRIQSFKVVHTGGMSLKSIYHFFRLVKLSQTFYVIAI